MDISCGTVFKQCEGPDEFADRPPAVSAIHACSISARDLILAVLAIAASFPASGIAGVPECAHWTYPYVADDFMPPAEVIGESGQRLELFRQNPQVCRQERSSECVGQRYLLPGDRVLVGHECDVWAHVQYRSTKGASVGWVERSRLRKLPLGASVIAARKRWRERQNPTELERAVSTGRQDEVRRLVRGPEDRVRALDLAVVNRQAGVVSAMIADGAGVRDSANPCQTVVNAVHAGAEILSTLLAAGFPLNCTTGAQKVSPLKAFAMSNRAASPIWAAMGHALDPGVNDPSALMSVFLRFGADLDVKDVWGGSPLRATAEPNNVDIAELLLAAGADVDNDVGGANSTSIAEQHGHTVLMEALRWYPLRWDPTLMRVLLRHGADVNFRSPLPYDEECARTTSGKCTFRGQTVLTRAATEGYLEIVKLLLESGADPSLSRTDGTKPASVARQNGHPKVAQLIEAYELRQSRR